MKHTPQNRKVHWVGVPDPQILGKSVEIVRSGTSLNFELFLGEDVIAFCRIAEPLEKWAFNHGADKVVTVAQPDWLGDQE